MSEDVKCPICLNHDFDYLGVNCIRRERENFDGHHFECGVCGNFDLSCNAYDDFTESQKNYKEVQRSAVSHKIKTKTIKKEKISYESAEQLEKEFEDAVLPDLHIQSENIVRFIGDWYKNTGAKLDMLPVDFHAIIGSRCRDDVKELVSELESRGLLKIQYVIHMEPKNISLSIDGSSYYSELKSRLKIQ